MKNKNQRPCILPYIIYYRHCNYSHCIVTFLLNITTYNPLETIYMNTPGEILVNTFYGLSDKGTVLNYIFSQNTVLCLF